MWNFDLHQGQLPAVLVGTDGSVDESTEVMGVGYVLG